MYNSYDLEDGGDVDEACDTVPFESIDGDPYRSQGVTRSVPVALGGDGISGIGNLQDLATLDADPFNKTPVVMRSCDAPLSGLEEGWANLGSFGGEVGCDMAWRQYLDDDDDDEPPPLCVSPLLPSKPAFDGLVGPGRPRSEMQSMWPTFPNDVEPKEQPVGGPPTTITVEHVSPSTVANSLCDFFKQMAANLEKFDLEKLLLEIMFFSGSLSCIMGMRIFKSPGNNCELKVEFSRHQGDGIVFSRVFREASRYLQERFPNNCKDAVVLAFPLAKPPPPPDSEDEDEDEDDAKYVNLMLASLNSPPTATMPETETIAALASAAESKNGVKHITAALDTMKMDLGKIISGLISSTRVELAYQGARLARQLSMQADPIRVIAIKVAAEECLCRATTAMAVRAELGRIVGGG